MQIVINIDETILKRTKYEYYGENEVNHSLVNEILISIMNGTVLPKEYEQLLYIKGQKDMANAIRKAIDERKENLSKGNMKIGLMIAHNIVNNVYRELVKADKEFNRR